MKNLLLACTLLASMQVPSAAYPIRPAEPGHVLPVCQPLAGKDATLGVKDGRKVQTFDAASSARLMAAFNAAPPQTGYDTEGVVVDLVTMPAASAPLPYFFFVEQGDLFCEMAVFDEAHWKALADAAFTGAAPVQPGLGI